DADYAGCKDTFKGTSGEAQFLGEKLVSWSSKKQDCTTLSTAEAEYVHSHILQPGSTLKNKTHRCPLPFHKEHVEKGTIELYFVKTDYQLDDIFTKAFLVDRFNYLVRRFARARGIYPGTLPLDRVEVLAESKFKTPCSIIKDKYMMKAQLHVSKSSAIFDVLYTNDDWNEVKQLLRMEFRLTLTSVPTEVVVDEAVYEEMYDSVEKAATTATGLNAERDRGIISKTQFTTTLNEPSSIGTISSSRPRRQETMGDAATQTRVLALETTKTNQALVIGSLKRRAKKLKKKTSKRTHKINNLYKIGSSRRIESSDEASLGDQEYASKQGRIIDNLDVNEGVTLVDETHRRNDQDMFDTGVLDDEEVVAEKEVNTADPVTTADKEETESSKIRAEGSSKRAREELKSDKFKKQKLDEKVEAEEDNDQEEAEMKMYMKIVFDNEITIDAIPLATKPPIIVDWKIIKEG
nr:hypothetical protein [Tanacetum cinerariifolium]